MRDYQKDEREEGQEHTYNYQSITMRHKCHAEINGYAHCHHCKYRHIVEGTGKALLSKKPLIISVIPEI